MATSAVAKQTRRVQVACWILIYVLPVAVWLVASGNPLFYLWQPALPGQQAYILAKFAGFIALYVLGIQGLLVLLSRYSAVADSLIFKHFHRCNGLIFLAFLLLHIVSFIVGVSIRTGQFNYQVLIPNFSGYYPSMTTIGLFTAVAAIVLVVVPTAYAKITSRKSTVSALHKLSPIMIFGASWHALTIGSEMGNAVLLSFVITVNVAAGIHLITAFFTGYQTPRKSD